MHLTYQGTPPIVIPPQDIKEILALMHKQLDILKQMTSQVFLMESGTKITRQDLAEK